MMAQSTLLPLPFAGAQRLVVLVAPGWSELPAWVVETC
jgi:hypothetical protein